MYNIIDLFCGCGGLSLGFELAGYRTLLGIDNDKAAIETFEKNHKGSIGLCTDITEITKEEILRTINYQNVDVVVGGPPCQGMSIAGPRKLHDPRNKLYLSFIRIVEELQPKAFVIENVPGLVSLFKGAIKDSILEEFNRIGYTVNYQILNAADYGVPQLRKRVFFVGLKNGKKFVFPEPKILFENDWITAEEATSDLPLLEDSLGNEIEHYVSEPKNEFQSFCRRNSKVIYNHQATNHSEQTKKIISLVPEGGNFKDLPEGYRKTRNFNVAWTRYHSKRPALTIDTGHRHHFHYKANRVPTVRENARFQSFPDDFIFYGNRTQQYRQVGNAVPPLLAKAIAEQLTVYLE
ncbi:DNA cytosine methyltransferase [Anoxybacillus sp. CHMUD]|uniref:DNA cytosine methyltransferase n=1 Tax=Anoxybacillus sp. CHMUD TaxID=2508870 RepID=UPI000542579E|nr:DNA cytosine methyltransferase [Anoxybacillus sp. CHMUD]KHF29181.1 Modification methylase BspRI [Anoxybacillus sp. BCO1]NNU90607.1 DNA cytosine methyltransferase [Anoxybacillus sp. CHMUD]